MARTLLCPFLVLLDIFVPGARAAMEAEHGLSCKESKRVSRCERNRKSLSFKTSRNCQKLGKCLKPCCKYDRARDMATKAKPAFSTGW